MFDESEAKIPVSEPVMHTGVCCDHCSVNDFEGTRYKCLICASVDLCERCYESGAEQAHYSGTHYFVRLDKPVPGLLKLTSPILGDRSKNVHPTRCDLCSSHNPIVGSRYYCVQCQINLCEACEFMGKHDISHPRMKFCSLPQGGNASNRS